MIDFMTAPPVILAQPTVCPGDLREVSVFVHGKCESWVTGPNLGFGIAVSPPTLYFMEWKRGGVGGSQQSKFTCRA